MSASHGSYYVPEYSPLPIIAAIGIFCIGYGSIHLLHAHLVGPIMFFGGSLIIAGVMFAWFRAVFLENKAGLLDAQMDRSYRWGMFWFIFTEVCFFGIFFGALFYTRIVSVPNLAGEGNSSAFLTQMLLWPNFKATWPLLVNPDPQAFPGPAGTLHTWRIPALNTLILLSSAVAVTWAHWGIKKNNQRQFITGLIITIVLGFIFLSFQAYEYVLAHTVYQLTMSSGIYGSTFFMLTGFHAAHVTIGAIMLCVILVRATKGHFNSEDHFGFEASAWYWHFVDVVWLFLFIFVYWF
ncbi:MAG: cytochrome c oxidase subunit 3 [Pseudomonadota bacterium]